MFYGICTHHISICTYHPDYQWDDSDAGGQTGCTNLAVTKPRV